MTDTHLTAHPESDIDLPNFEPAEDEYRRYIDPPPLFLNLACALHTIGRWDDYGVRVLTNEGEEYATVHFRIPAALPASSAARLATFATQRIPYTDRDRAWDELSAPTSNRDRWSCFVDSVIAAVNFAHAAVESAVWAHARGEEWTWDYSPPGRVEDKYERWGHAHPDTYDPESDYENYLQALPSTPRGPTEDDIQF